MSTARKHLRRALLLALMLGLAATGLSRALLPAEFASQIEVRIVPEFAGVWPVSLVASYAAYLDGKAAEAARISRVPVTSADLFNQSDIACQRHLRSLNDVWWQYWPPWDPATLKRLLHQYCHGIGMDAVLLITVNDRDPGRAQALSQAWFDVLNGWRSSQNASRLSANRIHVRVTSTSLRNLSLERMAVFGEGGGFVFNSIHNVQARTPVENLLALYEAVNKYR